MHLNILHLKLCFMIMLSIKSYLRSIKHKIYFDAFNCYMIWLFLSQVYYWLQNTNFLFLDSISPILSQQQIHNNITYLLIALTIIEYDSQHHPNNVNFFVELYMYVVPDVITYFLWHTFNALTVLWLKNLSTKHRL